jgi:hypothetical protein
MLHKYLREHFNLIEGWCYKFNWLPLYYLDQAQRQFGRNGPICEIGVFKGKLFIGLMALKHDTRNHVAIDVFDQQQFNLDGNGKPIRVSDSLRHTQRDQFEQNIRQCGFDLKDTTIIQADSLDISFWEIRARPSNFHKFSFFSVDGCHELTHAYNDIKIAFELTSNEGIILVDDYYHADWPGVHEAVAKLYFSESPKFVPLYYVFNKLALCHVNLHSSYLHGLGSYLKANFPVVPIRKVKRYGWESITISPPQGTKILPDLAESEMRTLA